MSRKRGRPPKERIPYEGGWAVPTLKVLLSSKTEEDEKEWLYDEAFREWRRRLPLESDAGIHRFLAEWLRPETKVTREEILCGIPTNRLDDRKNLARLLYEKKWHERYLSEGYGMRIRDLPKYMNREVIHNPLRKRIRELEESLDSRVVSGAERDSDLMMAVRPIVDGIVPGEKRAPERNHVARALNAFLDFVDSEQRLPTRSELRMRTIDRMEASSQKDRILNFPQFSEIRKTLGINTL